MSRATTSFPTPDSPCRHVVVPVAATWIALLSTSHKAGDSPTGLPRQTSSRNFSVRHSRACRSGGPHAAAWSLVSLMLTTVLITFPQSCVRTYRRLLLLLKCLPVGLAIGMKATVFASLPVGFELDAALCFLISDSASPVQEQSRVFNEELRVLVLRAVMESG